MNDCDGVMGFLWGHKFEARYDEMKDAAAAADIKAEGVSAQALTDLMETRRNIKKIYVHDVCIRCGQIIKR